MLNILNFSIFQAHKCPNDMVKCQDGLQCVYKKALCRGYAEPHCKDGSDQSADFCRGMSISAYYRKIVFTKIITAIPQRYILRNWRFFWSLVY